MANEPQIPVYLFARWLLRRRDLEGWKGLRHDRDLKKWPWPGLSDPWNAVVHYLSAHTGISIEAVERYMENCVSAWSVLPPDTADTYTQCELHKWWESGQGEALIRKFWQAYPDVAKRMHGLPKLRARAVTPKGRKRSKRTMPTPRELQFLFLEAKGYSDRQIARQMKITPGRVSQLRTSAGQRADTPASRSIPLGKSVPLMDHDGVAPKSKKRTRPPKDD